MKKSLPVGAIVMLIILALATVGVGYGLWSKTLVIRGEVNTGFLDAGLSLKEVDQSYDFNDGTVGNGVNDDDEWLGKDVAECVAELIDPWTMDVTITNAYPSFNCFVRYDVHSRGTIPFDLYGPDYFYDMDGDGEMEFIGTGGLYTIEVDELHVNTFPFCGIEDGMQVDPDDPEVLCDLHVHVKQGAAQKAQYKFRVRLWARQWNEYWETPPWRP
jgi:hypothetical protein